MISYYNMIPPTAIRNSVHIAMNPLIHSPCLKNPPKGILFKLFHTVPKYRKRLRSYNLNPIPAILFAHSVFLIELVNTAAGLSCFLLPCVEWMALGTNLHVDVLFRRTCHKRVAAVTSHSCLMICWMYSFFHDLHLFFIRHMPPQDFRNNVRLLLIACTVGCTFLTI